MIVVRIMPQCSLQQLGVVMDTHVTMVVVEMIMNVVNVQVPGAVVLENRVVLVQSVIELQAIGNVIISVVLTLGCHVNMLD